MTDGFQGDGGAGQGDFQRFLFALADHGHDDICANFAFHLGDGFGQGQAHDLLTVKLGNIITRLDAGAGGRCIVNRRDHTDNALVEGDFHAKSTILALGLNLHIVKPLGGQVTGMGVEGA